MSLLSEEKKTVIDGLNLVNSIIRLGTPTFLVGGVQYKKIVSKPVTPGAPGNVTVLLDAATNQPINLYNKVLLSVVQESDPELVGSSPSTTIDLGLKPEPTTSGFFNNFYITSLSAINSKQYNEFSDAYQSGYVTTSDYPYMAVRPSGVGNVTAGQLVVTLVVVDVPVM